MTRKLDGQEPLLTAVARKVGQAAGTLANMAHKLTADQAPSPSQAPPKSRTDSPESANKKTNAATLPQDRTTNQRHATPKKRTRPAKAQTASRGNTTGTKRNSRRKG